MTVLLCPSPVFTSLLSTGAPNAFGQLSTYQAGTTTPQASYIDSTGSSPNTNPIILNASGQANVWLTAGQFYKLVLTDAAGNQIWSVDQVPGGGNNTPLTQAILLALLANPPAELVMAGIANTYVAALTGSVVSGQSFGLEVLAGTTAADIALLIQNQAGSATFLKLFGDGHGTLGPTATSGLSWTTTGVLTLSVSGVPIFSVNGITGPTIQGYGPTAAALVDLTPDTGTFTITYTGFTANPTGTAVWTRVGNLVALFLPTGTATSNATTMTGTGLPAAIQPTRAQVLPLALGVIENATSTNVDPYLSITAGTLSFGIAGAIGGFTNSGTKGIAVAATVTYLLN